MLYWSARLGETRCGFWHPLETSTSSARRSIHPPSSVGLLPFPLLGLFLCSCGLAARESDASFCHGFTIADIWSMTLRVVTPAATFLEALSLVQQQKAESGVTLGWKACEDQCLLQTGSETPDLISLISVTYVIFLKNDQSSSLIPDFHPWNIVLYLWCMKDDVFWCFPGLRKKKKTEKKSTRREANQSQVTPQLCVAVLCSGKSMAASAPAVEIKGR